mmetsp:Transcript_18126/g.38733  ORF Transcript_18126/g.38733 Transcript_18126/m.38733 type:complete len:414 (+) Transcript_18126:197-1438(+)
MSLERELRICAPIRLRAQVVHGVGRGSKLLGFPTANLAIRWDKNIDDKDLSEEERAVLEFASNNATGIYCAFGSVENLPDGGVHKVAMSMGWNPSFQDIDAKVIEPWILHDFPEDFYGHYIRLTIVAFVRGEAKLSFEDLKVEIGADGDFVREALDTPELSVYSRDPFLLEAQRGHCCPKSCSLEPVLRRLPPLEADSVRVLLVRHGEAEANHQGLLCGGGNDSLLTDAGHEQAKDLARAVRAGLRTPLRLVGSSSLRRAVDTADAVASEFPKVQRTVCQDLKEMAYGTMEGAKISEIREFIGEVSKKWKDGQTKVAVGGGESPEGLVERTTAALESLVADRQGQTVLLACHSWVNKAMIASVLPNMGLSRLQDIPQRNCALNVLDCRIRPSDGKLEVQVLGIDLSASDSCRL